ncbi:HNH endonuclease signature motif containing protein [Hyalangium rubrum]|uniref:HNH endonuclease signature motif containing protein n=1 Tax=Hyalangium rubrum TaxID=3103134 RepID=A0ABU5GYJ9_9BACT|nr:HNH endonuclease signature motif containing protein [Hyalangium sp. s54d21]MDY7225779.1 HNH endonuclease signature motif containing protein [Hyalangium sp. s54d21]
MRPPRKKPLVFEGIKLDERMALAIISEGCYFDLWPEHDEDYPWVFTVKDHRPVYPLHVYVWLRNHGPLLPGHVIHHRDHNKLNAQLSNLEAIHRSDHAKRHREERQKFSPRKREDYGGLYRPHAPEPVRELTLSEMMRLLRRGKLSRPPSPSSRPPVEEEEFREAEKKLKAALHDLMEEVDHLDSGQPIPRVTTRRRGNDIKLGLGKKAERRGCTPAEAALVRALVKHERAESPDEAVAAELDLPLGVVKKMKMRPSVDLAITRWRCYQRLPPPGFRKKKED